MERDTCHNFHRLPCLHTREGGRTRSRSGVHSFSKQCFSVYSVLGTPGVTVAELQLHPWEAQAAMRKVFIIHSFSWSIITCLLGSPRAGFMLGSGAQGWGQDWEPEKQRSGWGLLKSLSLPGTSSHLRSLGLSLRSWLSESRLSWSPITWPTPTIQISELGWTNAE